MRWVTSRDGFQIENHWPIWQWLEKQNIPPKEIGWLEDQTLVTIRLADIRIEYIDYFVCPLNRFKKKSKTETKRNSTDFWSLIQQNAVAMESFEDVPLRNDLLPLTAQFFQAKPSISDGSGSPWCQVACPCPSSLCRHRICWREELQTCWFQVGIIWVCLKIVYP